mmetsp:Transcript_15841/g.35240  ORF Transcript_15841/g.35240 Transcript_15841/m.35240 type:complete len:213 (-) Transcript_15841:809-1447(-)
MTTPAMATTTTAMKAATMALQIYRLVFTLSCSTRTARMWARALRWRCRLVRGESRGWSSSTSRWRASPTLPWPSTTRRSNCPSRPTRQSCSPPVSQDTITMSSSSLPSTVNPVRRPPLPELMSDPSANITRIPSSGWSSRGSRSMGRPHKLWFRALTQELSLSANPTWAELLRSSPSSPVFFLPSLLRCRLWVAYSTQFSIPFRDHMKYAMW